MQSFFPSTDMILYCTHCNWLRKQILLIEERCPECYKKPYKTMRSNRFDEGAWPDPSDAI